MGSMAPMRKPKSGGGWQAIRYTLAKAREAGGLLKLWKAMRTKNACKTCALGMGGQMGGMVNEAGHFPEVCKKSLQAMVADMQGAIRADFFGTYSIAQLQSFTPRELEICGRLTQPLLHRVGENYYRPISWEEAIRRIAEKLNSIEPDQSFWYFSGRSSNEAGFLLQLFARLYGTNNVNNCSYYCHQASGVGLSSAIGSGAGTVQLDDIEHADLVFLIGGNPASNHPRLMRSLMMVRRRGGEVIVVNPIVETGLVNFRVPSDVRSLLFGTKIATNYVQPHIGGDLAMLYGVAKRIDEMGAVDEQFVSKHCTQWPELRERLRSLSWDEITVRSGVARGDIDAMADRYAGSKNTVFMWTMGITHHAHGVANVQAIANLALLRGMIGRRHAGVLPIRGHSNVQGIGTVGVTPKLKDAIFERLQSHFGVQLPTRPGYDTIAGVEAAARGELKFAMCLGGNLFGSNPDAAFVRRAMGEIDLVAYLNTTLNTGHAHGLGRETIVLPVLARDEEPEPTTQESMFSYVRLSDGGPRRHDGPRSEVEIIAELAERVMPSGGPVEWAQMRSAGRIRNAIARIVPGLEKIGEIDRTKQEFAIPGRAFHTPQFATPDGKARLHVHELPELAGSASAECGVPATAGRLSAELAGSTEYGVPSTAGKKLRLMTIRSEGQFNTVVYEDYDLYRGVERRDVILLHPADIIELGLAHGQRVRVKSGTGEMAGMLVQAFADIRPGNAAMYYPEANALVPRAIDPLSKTPAFKCVVVTIEPMAEPTRAAGHDNAKNGSSPADANGEPALITMQPASGAKTSRGQMRAC
jgi:molybdopterin-dependent oxidoreductase alpha subunit